MARRKGFDEDESGASPTYPTKPRHSCVANGCPVVAGIQFDGGQSICRFHDGQPASQWQEITRRLREREWMVRLCDWLFGGEGPHGMPDWPQRARNLAEEHGRLNLAPDPKRRMPSGVIRDEREHPTLLAQRINSVLSVECCAEKRAPLPPRAPKGDGPVSAGSALRSAGW